MKIQLKHKIKNDAYTEYLYNAFDIQNKEESNVEIENNIRLDFEWHKYPSRYEIIQETIKRKNYKRTDLCKVSIEKSILFWW